jgi:rhodanese-related sulfurtransferase
MVGLFPVEKKNAADPGSSPAAATHATGETDGSRSDQREQSPLAASVVPPDGPLVLDVRTPEEFKAGAVPGAISLPLDELESRAQEVIGDTDREVIVYCASGARSGYARRVLSSMGYANVKNGGGLHDMFSVK